MQAAAAAAAGPRKIFSLEGLIGLGKSTLLIELEKQTDPNVTILPEPVARWREGGNLLKKYYNSPAKYAFAWQMNVLLTLTETHGGGGGGCLLTERSLGSCQNVFARLLRREGNLDDFENEVFSKWAEFCTRNVTYAKHIFLELEPEICFQRMRRRNREEEGRIELDYLKRMQVVQAEWYHSLPPWQKMTIDMNGIEIGSPEYQVVVQKIVSVLHNV